MYKLQTLNNGLRLVTIPVAGTKTVTVLVMVGTGSRHETKDNNGISHFLEHMFFKGTRKRPTTMIIASELDSVGGEYNAFTSKEFTGFYAKVDASKLDLAMDVLSDMLLNSKFDKQEIEKEKGTIIEEINMYEDNPMAHIEDIFEECLYGDQPAGWETIGTKENIKKFRREDFINYLRSQYGVENSVVCVAGKIDKKTAGQVEKYFGKFRKTDFKEKLKIIEKQDKPSLKMMTKKTDQAHISLGVRTFGVGHKDEYTLKLLAVILGGSMSSRLFINLREKKGLAYYVRTMAEFHTDSGYLTTQAGVPVDKVDEAIRIILKEYKKIFLEKINPSEIKRVKDNIRGKVVINMESSDNNASWFARQMIMKEKVLTVEEYLRKIEKVTAGDLKRVGKEIFVNKGLNLAVIGPYEDRKKFERILKF